MKSLKKVLLAVVSFIIISFFGRDVVVGQAASDGGTYMEVTVGDDISFRAEGDSKCIGYDWGNGEFSFYGMKNFEDLENSEGVVISFDADLKPGEYPLISDNTTAKFMVYYTDGKKYIHPLVKKEGH